jgi:hypothetical protein
MFMNFAHGVIISGKVTKKMPNPAISRPLFRAVSIKFAGKSITSGCGWPAPPQPEVDHFVWDVHALGAPSV